MKVQAKGKVMRQKPRNAKYYQQISSSQEGGMEQIFLRAPEGINLVGIFISDLQPLQLWDNRFLLFKSPCLQSLVMEAFTNTRYEEETEAQEGWVTCTKFPSQQKHWVSLPWEVVFPTMTLSLQPCGNFTPTLGASKVLSPHVPLVSMYMTDICLPHPQCLGQ